MDIDKVSQNQLYESNEINMSGILTPNEGKEQKQQVPIQENYQQSQKYFKTAFDPGLSKTLKKNSLKPMFGVKEPLLSSSFKGIK